jgi:hypothetical protein
MMGRLEQDQGQLFYSFCLEEVVPDDHQVRTIASVLDLSWVYGELSSHYPALGRPTGERIRDKIAASKQKGMWMGGWVPIGYDRHGGGSDRVGGALLAFWASRHFRRQPLRWNIRLCEGQPAQLWLGGCFLRHFS